MTPKPFEIGLTLTGTVSAGAYTAGVVDFILDALEEWDKLKAANRAEHQENYDLWTVPWHDVVITGLSGASGGGVSCGLLLNLLGRDLEHVREPIARDKPAPENDLYNTWVESLGIDELTSTSDSAAPPLRSLMNGNALPDIAKSVLQKSRFGNSIKRNYISDNLIATLTITNLRGIPYLMHTKGIGATSAIYNRHADFIKFELSKNSNHQHTDKQTNLIPYNKDPNVFDPSYDKLFIACLSTCAFPAAFISPVAKQNDSDYLIRPNGRSLAIPQHTDYSFLCADGGILNTNPFELLKKDMLPLEKEPELVPPECVNRAIIIVAPLDTEEAFKDDYNTGKNALADTLPAVIAAIRNEAMFSAEDIEDALNENAYSRYIIAPIRYVNDKLTLPAITATSLNTFGAFLSRDFREHDYFLGRRNAQRFIQKHFAIPFEHAVVHPLFTHLNLSNETNENRFTEMGLVFTDDGKKYFSLIPLCGKVKEPLYDPAWPKGKYEEAEINNDLNRRTSRIIDTLLADVKFGLFIRIAKFFLLNKIKKAVAAYLMEKVMKSLQESKLK